MKFWYFALAVATLTALSMAFQAGRAYGFMECRVTVERK